MVDLLTSRLFDPSGRTPHGFCLLWEPRLIRTEALANGVAGLAYFSIRLTLMYFARRRHDLMFRPLFHAHAAGADCPRFC